MKRITTGFLCLLAAVSSAWAGNENESQQDSVIYHLEEVIVSTSTKETNDLRTLPGSVSFINASQLETQRIASVKDLSALVPNFFIPNYGSRMTVPVYIRGIGERSTGQSIGLYVDGMSYLDKSTFDFDFMDVRQIEVLRGPQGTLYGRNAMGGIVNITTLSPLQHQMTRAVFSAGSYGELGAKASTSQKLTDNVGLSLGVNYAENNGYFTNRFDQSRADWMRSLSLKGRLDWQISPRWLARLSGSLENSKQGAFPYGLYSDGEIAAPNYNAPGNYDRLTGNINLNLQYRNNHVLFNSSTGFQHLNDDMKMDTDYTSADMFELNQLQHANAWTQELTLKSITEQNYQWAFGAFGFYNRMRTDVTTTMGPVAVTNILQKMFDDMRLENPRMPQMSVTDERIDIPGTFRTPSYGVALFHQSTYNDLLVDGLSVTAGVRLDYEKVDLNYDTSVEMNLDVRMPFPPFPIVSDKADTLMIGSLQSDYFKVLPKVAVKYELNEKNYLYATVSSGYKAGGYNIQNFADIARDALRAKYDTSMTPGSVKSQTLYKPESSWNYEIGFKGEIIPGYLSLEASMFYIDIKDMQVTDYVSSGQGRILKNAGRAESLGGDLSLNARLHEDLSLRLNYGYTRAVFKEYQSEQVDYSGCYVPFAPQNTLSVGALYNKRFAGALIDRLHAQAQYNANGRIYWTESNDVYQDFYGLLNLRAGVDKGIFGLSLWANNLFDTNYTAFYFEGLAGGLAQGGRPFTCGVDLTVKF